MPPLDQIDQVRKNWVRALGLTAVLFLVFGGVFLADQHLVSRSLLAEGPPVYSVYFALRMMGAVVLAMAAAMLAVIWNGGTFLTLLEPPSRRFSFAFALLCLAGTVGGAVLMVMDPVTFSRLALEDSYVEWCSAFMLLAASAVMAMSGGQFLKKRDRLLAAAVLLASAVLFIIAMEEISWMQRVIGFRTPDILQGRNSQGEANVHNLATNLAENLFYGGAFVLLVFLPTMAFLFRPAGPLAAFSPLLPSRYALLVGALSTAFSYEMWNIFWIQFAFFLGVLLLGGLAGEAVRLRLRLDGLLFGCAALALVGCQLAGLHFGAAMVRRWDDTEFKEMIIAAGLFLQAVEVLVRVRSASRRPAVTDRGS